MVTDSQIAARDYLSPRAGAFWRWNDRGEVLEWRSNGVTIAFAEEVRAVLEHLAPSGLPPFDALVLLFAMCREDWPPEQLQKLLAAEPLGLRMEMPKEIRGKPKGKALLAEVLLGGVLDGDPIRADRVVAGMRQGIPPEDLHERGGAERGLPVSHCVDIMRRSREKVDRESIRLRWRTGIDEEPRPADLDLPVAERVQRLLASLRDDPELSGIAALAHDLLAAVHVPRPMSDPEDLPLGGYTDISNRGQLDRLLLSELAHDDDTLMMRIALNEALYVRREAPPRLPTGSRCILLDSGIRTWGVPRAYAAAVALAVIVKTEPRADVQAYGAREYGIERVDLSTREGLVSHLEVLETESHPGGAMESFLVTCRAAEGPVDAIVVTHADVVTDPGFRRGWTLPDDLNLFVATVDRSGAFQLHAWKPRGTTPICQAVLDLEALLPKSAPQFVATDPDLPVILSTEPFPLLLSHQVNPAWAATSSRRGALTLTRDGRLMQWQGRTKGARQVTDRFPEGVPRFLSWIDDTGALALLDNKRAKDRRIVRVDLETAEVSSVSTHRRPENLIHALALPAGLCLIHHDTVDLVDLATGNFLQRLKIPPGFAWRRDRFFCHVSWYALFHDGSRLSLQEVPGTMDPEIVGLFDMSGRDGPFAVTASGQLICTSTKELEEKMPKQVQLTHLTRVSDDGREILATGQRGVTFRWNLNTGRCTEHARPEFAVLCSLHEWICQRNLYRHVIAISFDAHGLKLVTRRNETLHVSGPLGSQGGWISLNTSDQRPREKRGFKKTESPAGCRYELSVATWDDGSRAYLDSRGLLHLVSSDPDLPQLSIVLTSGQIAAWSSAGQTWGKAYYLPEPVKQSEESLTELLSSFATRLR